ncbi:MAG TPA: hypothetical protein VGH65_10590 [Verrucomicrobiaceae bacterium]|jgi:hypothetical protein
MNFSFLIWASIGFAAAFSTVRADDEPADLDLPQPFDAASAQTILDSSPFTRSLNLSDSLTLTGIAYVEGKPVATLLNRATKESFIVSEEPNSQGWKLATASPDSELRHTQVKIMVGPEIVTVRYGDEQLSPEHAKKNGSSRDAPPSSFGSSSKTQYRSSSYLGDNGRDRYYSLSDQAREKFKDNMHKLIDKHPEMTPEQRSVYAEKYFARAQAEDQGQGQAPKQTTASVKLPKPPKGSR